MRLTRKLSRHLLYALLLLLSGVIIRDTIIILNARYGLFLHQNIFLPGFPKENKREAHMDSKVPVNRRTDLLDKLNTRQEEGQRDRIVLQKLPDVKENDEKRSYQVPHYLEKRKIQKKIGKEEEKKIEKKETKKKVEKKYKTKGKLLGKRRPDGTKKRIVIKKSEKGNNLTDIDSFLEYLRHSSFRPSSPAIEKNYKTSILLAYPRSGSSFVGQVLSSYNHTMYMFEPLFLLIKKTYELVDTDIVPIFLDKIFSCDPITMDYLRKKLFVLKTKKEVCETTKWMLIKTIRLRLKVAMEWLQLNPNIKVIHLVRDPRGIIASMKKGPFREKNATVQCQHIHEDYINGNQLQKNRYIRIKYEDLVDQPENNFKKLFTFMDLPYNDDVKSSVLLHTQAEKLEQQSGSGKPKIFKIGAYYSLYRFSKFHHDHSWKSMTRKNIQKIETECEDVMKELKYKPSTQ